MALLTLDDWLNYINKTHPMTIALGLERTREVASRLNLLDPKSLIVMVGGTNGKGSTVAGLEAIYLAAGYQVGAFTSPFLFHFSEQVRINGQAVTEKAFCYAFEKIESIRGDIPLTPFEFTTLAAFLILSSQRLDVWLLEIGLGGRLDAVNVLTADVAIVTSIDKDHMEWLGSSRETIGFEKAGIFKADRPAICGDINPPQTLIDYSYQIKAPLYRQGKDFSYQAEDKDWSWNFSGERLYESLPPTALAIQNMSTVLMAITLLQKKLPVKQEVIIKGLSQVTLPGRIQVIKGPITTIFDVSHNPHAINLLKTKLAALSFKGKVRAIFSMLVDKDILTSILTIKDEIDSWYIAPLQTKRAAAKEALISAFQIANIQSTKFYQTIAEAYQAALKATNVGDVLIIFGSFHTVAEAANAARIPLALNSTLCTRK